MKGLLQAIENQLGDCFQRREDAETFGSNRFKTWDATRIQFPLETLDGQSVCQVALVVLKYPGNVVESQAVLLKVVDHVLERLDIVSRAHDIGVCDEYDAVHAVQDQLAAGVVFDLSRNRIERESGFETLDAAQIERQEVEEQSSLCFCCQTDQFAASSWRQLAMNVLEIGGLATKPGAVINNFAVYLSRSVVYECHP